MTKSTSNNYELSILHPIIANMLTQCGYTYEHEVVMPEYGRADFVTTNVDKQLLVIEAKWEIGHGVGRDCAQLLDYVRQLGKHYTPVMIIPVGHYENISALLHYDIMLIELSVPHINEDLNVIPTIRQKMAGITGEMWMLTASGAKIGDSKERITQVKYQKFAQRFFEASLILGMTFDNNYCDSLCIEYQREFGITPQQAADAVREYSWNVSHPILPKPKQPKLLKDGNEESDGAK